MSGGAVPASVPALVTGASSGIGAEFARRFAERGHDLTIVARRVDRLEQLAEELRAEHNVQVAVIGVDLETARGRTTVSRVLKSQAPWIVVNNAGFGSRGRVRDLDAGRERGEVQVNVVATHELTLAALPGLIQSKAGGVINVASTAGLQPLPYMATYAGTKAFVRQLTLNLRADLHGTGVRVSSIEPGMVETEFTLVRTGGNQAASDTLYGGADPMTAEDIAATIAWVATLPPHLNINTLELMPVSQSFAGFQVARG